MGKLIEAKPAKTTFVFELDEDEVAVLGGLVEDLSDRTRKVHMVYPVDQDDVEPTEAGLKVLKGLRETFDVIDANMYDYFDWWKQVEVDKDEEPW